MPKPHYRPEIHGVAGGLNVSRHATVLRDGQTPDCENVDFSRDSARRLDGCLKFNNQIAPRSGVRTRVDRGLSGLVVRATASEGKSSVPLRGYVYHGYSADLDIGGDGVSDGGSLGAETFHERRGRSFEIELKFRLPETERLFSSPKLGALQDGTGSSSHTSISNNYGYDEALDECTVIFQKGGDRVAPMSFFIGIVNVGSAFELWTSQSNVQRVSNYALVVGWFDSAGWGEWSNAKMRYDLNNPSNSAAGAYSTQALRAFIVEKFIEPGREYAVSVQLKLDTATFSDTSWNDDGSIAVRVATDGDGLESYTYDPVNGPSKMHVWKGPSDSLEYLTKYGVRYSARDAYFSGLGYRTAAWNDQGFIAFGMDSAPLEHGGFQLVDCSREAPTDLYDNTYQLTFNHSATGDADVKVQQRAFVAGVTNLYQPPNAPRGEDWEGFGGISFGVHNTESLRGYSLIFAGDGDSNMRGGILRILDYLDGGSGGPHQVNFHRPNGGFLPTFTGKALTIRAFRWFQRELEIADVRIYSKPRDLSGERAQLSLQGSVDLDDVTEPDLDLLLACWPMDDAGGSVVREIVSGRDAYLAPFGMGLSKNGTRGENQAFLSGEGEALMLDLSKSPEFQREFARLQASGRGAFALEITCIMPEASYGVDEDTGIATAPPLIYKAEFAPTIATWDLSDPEGAGVSGVPRPLLRLDAGGRWSDTYFGILRPLGFGAQVNDKEEGESGDLNGIAPHYTTSDGFFWDEQAGWVGRTITLQIGVQSTGTDDEFLAYIAATPKDALFPEAGDPSQAEFAWFSGVKSDTQALAAFTIKRKDLLRSVITIGGAWNPKDLNGSTPGLGYTELNCRMIVDEVRVFGCAAPGSLPSSNGGVVSDGKILGGEALPPRALEDEELLGPVGRNVRAVATTDGGTTVSASGAGLFVGEPEVTADALRETFMLFPSDREEVFEEGDELPIEREQFHAVDSVASDGSTASLFSPYRNGAKGSVGARSFRAVGYTSLDDDLFLKGLTLSGGTPYDPLTATVASAHVVEDFFRNGSPVSVNWSVRIYSPLKSSAAADLLPSWCRGLGRPRRNPILGLHGQNADLFAAVRGALYECDDRWRPDGPSDTFKRSLAILAKPRGDAGVAFPLERDRVEFGGLTAAPVWPYVTTAQSADLTWVFDAWVKLRSIRRLQTIAWLGVTTSDQSLFPGSTDAERGFGWWLRLSNGVPEFVMQSSAALSGGGNPQDGRYVATGSRAIPVGEWVHLRMYLGHSSDQGGYVVAKKPVFLVNGKKQAVRVNGVDATAAALGSGYWIRGGNGGGVPLSFNNTIVSLGAARDSFRAMHTDRDFVRDALLGPIQFPDRVTGWLHALDGQLAGLTIWSESSSDPLVSGEPEINPFSIDPTAYTQLRMLTNLQEGVGHRVSDSGTHTFSARTPGVIRSHPFISLYHEFGLEDEQASFAVHGKRVFVANGGRVAQIDTDRMAGDPRKSTGAGVLPPTTKPTVRFEKFPLWVPNQNDNTATDRDPIASKDTNGKQILHLSSPGNSWLRADWNGEVRWERDESAGDWDMFGLKMMFRLRSTAGRIPLYSQRTTLDGGGPFLDVKDGFVRFGWYDTFLKKEVFVRTSIALVKPGRWYYVRIRKSFPMKNGWSTWSSGPFSGSSNWLNSVAGLTGAYSMDQFIVREFQTESLNATASNWPTYPVNTGSTQFVWIEHSFTTEDYKLSGITEPGLITPNDGSITFQGNGTTPGRIISSAALFTRDMVGMVFQWATGSAAGQRYRITSVIDSTNMNVVSEYGSTPTFSATAVDGGVCIGVSLVKSEDFDNSTHPDDSAYDIQILGSELAQVPGRGFSRFDGECAGFAVGVVSTSSGGATKGQDVPLFQKSADAVSQPDDARIGADWFPYPINDTLGSPGELLVDDKTCFACIHTQPYTSSPSGNPSTNPKVDPVSTEPNETLDVAVDSESSSQAGSFFWDFHEAPTLIHGRYHLQVVFHDFDQNVTSNPGPDLLVSVPPEERSNPSGKTRVVLENLPVSVDRGNIHRWVYMSQRNGANRFRVLIVPDSRSASASLVRANDRIPIGEILDYTNSPPPRARIVASSQERMFYLDVQLPGSTFRNRDFLVYSKPFEPSSVPLSNLLPVQTGHREALTGARDLNGSLVVCKRDQTFVVEVRNGAAFLRHVSDGVGCIAHQTMQSLDDRLYWLSVRGVYAYVGGGIPTWVGVNVEDFFTNDRANLRVDRSYLRRASAAIDRNRNQYVVALKAEGEDGPGLRLATEYDHELAGSSMPSKLQAGHRWSRYRDPYVTALSSVDARDQGGELFVAGTEEGFVVWMQRSDSLGQMVGDNDSLHGEKKLTVVSATSTTITVSTSGAETNLESYRGCKVRWLSGTTEREARILFVESGGLVLHLDRPITNLPVSGDVLEVGRMLAHYTTKWFSDSTPQSEKRHRFLDVVGAKLSSGKLFVHGFTDLDEAVNRLLTREKAERSIDLSAGVRSIPTNNMIGNFFQFSLFERTGTDPGAWEVTALVDRITDTDQH